MLTSVIYKGQIGNTGGPAGYLFNLTKSIEINKCKEINIVSQQKNYECPSATKSIKNIIKYVVPKRLIYSPKRVEKIYINFFQANIERIEQGNILHFHTTQELYFFEKNFKEIANRKIKVLTSHSPEPPYIEKQSQLLSKNLGSKLIRKIVDQQKMMDIEAFTQADFIVFPCKEAIEPYDNFFDDYTIDRNKLRFVLTSIVPIDTPLSKNECKKKYNIPTDKKIALFLGRKNKSKGYDIFCEIAKKMQKERDYIFISAGKGEIKPPNMDNLIDYGWTDKPAEFLQLADVVIMPNRTTYFDLGLLQALALDKKIVTSFTGGNRWFKGKGFELYYADNKNIESYCEMLLNLPEEQKINKKLFLKYFDIKHFSKRYKELYHDLYSH